MRVAPFAVSLSLFVFSVTAVAAEDAVRFRCDGSGGIIVPVTINGEGPFPFLLDTGSNRSMIRDDLAIRLSAPVVARSLSVTPAGTTMRLLVRLDRVSLGKRSGEDILASVVSAAELGAERLAGLIGQDFLLGLDYTLDYSRRLLVWDPADIEKAGVRLPLVESEGRFLVSVLQEEHDSVPLLLVPDSGSSTFVVFTRAGHTPLPIDSLGKKIGLAGVGTRTSAWQVRIRSLRLGNLVLRDEPAVAVERPGTDTPEGDGLLPLHRFSSVTFLGSRMTLIAR